MKQTILETKIKREKNFLYFVGTNSEGNLILCKTEMSRGKKKKE